MHMHVVFPREPAVFNVATASQTSQVWSEIVGHKDKNRTRCWDGWKSTLACQKWEASVTAVFWGNRIVSFPLHDRIGSDRAQTVSELIKPDVNGPMLVESLRSSKYYVQCVLLQQASQGVPRTIEVYTHVSDEVSTAGHAVKMF